VSVGCKCRFPVWGADSAPPNPIAGFEGPLRGGEKEKKEGREGKRKGTEGRGENIPPNEFMSTALSADWKRRAICHCYSAEFLVHAAGHM